MKNSYLTIILLFTLIVLSNCNDNSENTESNWLTENDFVFFPPSPIEGTMASLVTCDCGYNELVSVTRDGSNIKIKKRFNSQMKRPCILEFDTIKIGVLTKGAYNVTLTIIDINPMATDSVFRQKTHLLQVCK